MRDIPDHMVSMINPSLLEEKKRAEYLYIIENAMNSKRALLLAPDKNANTLHNKSFYRIHDIEITHRKINHSADFFFLLGTNLYSDTAIERALKPGGIVETKSAQEAFFAAVHKLFENANSSNQDSMLAYALLKSISESGKKIAFIRGHGLKSPLNSMLSLSTDPKTMKDEINLSEVVKEIARTKKYGLIFIDACNPERAPIDTRGVDIPVVVPMTDSFINSRHKARQNEFKTYLPAA